MSKTQLLLLASLVLTAPLIRSQTPPTAELTKRAPPAPKLVSTGLVSMSAAQARSSQMSALRAAESSLDKREVVALSGTEAVRLTEANSSAILSKPTLVAERVGTAATKVTLPASVWSKVSAHPVQTAYVLPTRFTAFTLQGNRPVSFSIVFAVLDSLHYDVGSGKFLGRLAMALVNPANHDDDSSLSHEVPVLVGAEAADITPADLRFTVLNAPQEVHLLVPSPTDPYRVQAMTALNHEPDSILMPIDRPDIDVRPVSSPIRGLGLEATAVVIRIAATQGRKGQEVALQTTRGSIAPSPVILDEGGNGVATLRSAAIGNAQITATDPPFHDGHGTVEFTWPIAFALATLLGGVVGALLRKDARQRPVGSISIGILAAAVVCVAQAVGVNIQAWGTPPGGAGEGLFFFLGATAGFLGREVISKVFTPVK